MQMGKFCWIQIINIFSDKVIFPLFEVIFLIIFFYAMFKERGWFTKRTSVTATVKRGEKSWNMLNLAYGIASVVLLQLINAAESLKGYKTIISSINLLMLFYLTFFVLVKNILQCKKTTFFNALGFLYFCEKKQNSLLSQRLLCYLCG